MNIPFGFPKTFFIITKTFLQKLGNNLKKKNCYPLTHKWLNISDSQIQKNQTFSQPSPFYRHR